MYLLFLSRDIYYMCTFKENRLQFKPSKTSIHILHREWILVFHWLFFFHHAGNKIVAITVEWQPLIATRVTSIYLNAETLRFTLLLQPVQLEAGVASLSTLILLLSFIVFFFWLWISSFLGIDRTVMKVVMNWQRSTVIFRILYIKVRV